MADFTWHEIDDINNLNIKENRQYLVCVENWNGHSSEWHPVLAYWYIEGSELTLREDDNTPHRHKIRKTGFYVVNDCGKDRFDYIYSISGAKYYADIPIPESSPDDSITIE